MLELVQDEVDGFVEAEVVDGVHRLEVQLLDPPQLRGLTHALVELLDLLLQVSVELVLDGHGLLSVQFGVHVHQAIREHFELLDFFLRDDVLALYFPLLLLGGLFEGIGQSESRRITHFSSNF